MTLHGMTTERQPDGTVITYGPLVAKYLNERVEAPKPLHGNDMRMRERKAKVHAALLAARK